MPFPASAPPLPPTGAVEVWWSPIDLAPAVLQGLRDHLDAATLERIERLVRPDDRRRAAVAHGLLRLRAGAVLGAGPSDLVIRRRCATCGATDHGKPELAPVPGAAAPPPAINLAHSGDLAVVALSTAGPVGVDVERARPGMDWESHHAHVFAQDEWEATGRAADPAEERLAAWTRKEAAAKATGHGVAVGLERVRVAQPADAGGWLGVGLPDGMGPARVRDIPVAAGHAAAVALVGDGPAPVLTVCQAEY